jgi:hypothetical protein
VTGPGARPPPSGSSGAEVLAVEARWTRGGALPPTHLHPAQDERFEVLDGRLPVLVRGGEPTPGPGHVRGAREDRRVVGR